MDKQKVIAVDGRFFATAGPGRYTKDIIEHLEQIDQKNKYIVFLRSAAFKTYVPKNRNFTKVLADYPWYSWSEQIFFLFRILSYNPDLLYVPHFNIPVLYPGKLVTAIPDLIMHTFSTEAGTTLWKPYFRFKKFVYKFVVLWAVLRTYRNICPSNDVRDDFIKYYPFVDKNKFIVSYEGIDPDLLEDISVSRAESVLKKYNVTKPYLLYVSSMYEHKNVSSLVKAFKILVDKYRYQGQLVIIGKKDKFSERIFSLVKELSLADRIVMPGQKNFIPDEEVTAFRKMSQLYVFPSLKEGFSLTPLEAQYFEIPCVISNIPCHKEIYDDSVVYFNPTNVKDIAEQISNVLLDKKLQKGLIAKGKENIKKYDWTNTAKDTLDVFNALLQS